MKKHNHSKLLVGLILTIAYLGAIFNPYSFADSNRPHEALHASVFEDSSIACPASDRGDIFSVHLFFTHRDWASAREKFGLPTYGMDDFAGGIPTEGDVPKLMVDLWRDKGVEIVDDPAVCASLAHALADVMLTTDTSDMRFIYVKLEEAYMVLYRKNAPGPGPFPPAVMLNSEFEVLHVAEK